MIQILFLLVVLIDPSSAIRFNYNLPKYQIQCFHETVEKDSRYQVSVKGETSQFYLHVVEDQEVHEDTRSVNAEYKYYSAFARNNSIMTFCVGNMGSKSIFFDIQFYHGLFLEDSFESNVRGHELEDLADRWGNLLKMVEANYEVYQRHLFGRRSSSQRLTFILTIMVALMIVGTAIIKCMYYRRVVTFLKEKKAV